MAAYHYPMPKGVTTMSRLDEIFDEQPCLRDGIVHNATELAMAIVCADTNRQGGNIDATEFVTEEDGDGGSLSSIVVSERTVGFNSFPENGVDCVLPRPEIDYYIADIVGRSAIAPQQAA